MYVASISVAISPAPLQIPNCNLHFWVGKGFPQRAHIISGDGRALARQDLHHTHQQAHNPTFRFGIDGSLMH